MCEPNQSYMLTSTCPAVLLAAGKHWIVPNVSGASSGVTTSNGPNRHRIVDRSKSGRFRICPKAETVTVTSGPTTTITTDLFARQWEAVGDSKDCGVILVECPT